MIILKKSCKLLWECYLNLHLKCGAILFQTNKVRNVEKIRNWYNQVQYLTQDTTWESDKAQFNITKREPKGQPIPAGDHKAAMNKRESITNTRQK